MESPRPQGNPRFERSIASRPVAIGVLNPCAVYLETTLSKEVPLLLAIFASSSQQTRTPQGETILELQGIQAFRWTLAKGDVRFVPAVLPRACRLSSHGDLFEVSLDRVMIEREYRLTGPFVPLGHRFAGHIRYLTQQEAILLSEFLPCSFELRLELCFASRLLKLSQLQEPSFGAALKWSEKMEKKCGRRGFFNSLFRPKVPKKYEMVPA